MAKHAWSVLCQRVVVDSQTNAVSLIDIFEQLTVTVSSSKAGGIIPETINVPIQYEIVTLWEKEGDGEERFNVQVEVEKPSGEKEILFDKETIIPSDNKRIRDIMKLSGFVANGNGVYRFKINYKEKGSYIEKANIPLDITIKTE